MKARMTAEKAFRLLADGMSRSGTEAFFTTFFGDHSRGG